MAKSLRIINVRVEGYNVNALSDTNCIVTVVSSRLVRRCEDESYIVAFGGSCYVKCRGRKKLKVTLRE